LTYEGFADALPAPFDRYLRAFIGGGQVLDPFQFQGHVSKFGFEDGSDIGTSAMPGRNADDIASRAVARLEWTDAGKKPVRLLEAGVNGLLPDRSGPGLTQPGSPRNDLMPA
jgi:hypothetical protein